MSTLKRRVLALLVVALLAAMATGLLAGCEASGYYDGDDESSILQLA